MKDTKKKVFEVIFFALLVALMFVFSWTPLGMVPLGTASATTIFIPVCIGICFFKDFKYSILLGFAFGLVSFIRSFVPNGPLDPYFQNPIVSVLPRMFVGVVGYFAYRVLHNTKGIIKYPVVGALVALFNTIFTMSTLLLVYYKDISNLVNNDFGMTVGALLGSIALLNMIPEIALGVVLTPAVMFALDKVKVSRKMSEEETNENETINSEKVNTTIK